MLHSEGNKGKIKMVIKIMRCCLPNKLVILRKHFNYSQQDLAKKLNVTINEYMAYENGNAMCSMNQLVQLADIYGISVDEMFVNSVDIELPSIEDSLEIPFINDLIEEQVEDTTVDKVMPSSLEQTREVIFDSDLNHFVDSEVEVENDGNTKQEDLAKTIVTRVVKEESASDGGTKQIKGLPAKKSVKSKNTGMMVGAGVVALVLISLVMWFIFGRSESSIDNKVGNVNRVLATDSYVAFVNDDKSVTVTGDNASLKMEDVVQISGNDNFVAGLKSDGHVEVTNGLDVKDFVNVTMIAAGDDHLVGLDNEGNILCVGNDEACKIDKIENVKSIYAGKDASLILTSSGELRAFGSASYVSSVDGMKDVTKVDVHGDMLAVIQKNGSVKVYCDTSYDTSSWVGIVDVACGKDFVVGLKNDGTLVYTGSEELGNKVVDFKNIKYIAAGDDYYVGCNANGKCLGDGNNSNNKFEVVSEREPLGNVTNFNFSITAKKVNMTWDAVENAKHYVVSIDTANKYSVNSATNSLSVDASKFESGKTYKVTIVAYGEDGISQSEEAVYDLAYVANTTALDSVTNISAKVEGTNVNITFDPVTNAKSYKITIPEINFETSVNNASLQLAANKFTEGTSYKIQVVAVGNDNFTDSQMSEYAYTHEGLKEKLATPNNISAKVDGDYVVFSWSTVANATEYTVTIDIDGFTQTTTSPSLSVDINKFANGNTYNVAVMANGSGKFTNSDSRSFSYKHEVKPKQFAVTYTDGNGKECSKIIVDENTSITLDGTCGSEFIVDGYMIGGTKYQPNSKYTVVNDVTITILGKCPDGKQYTDPTNGCVVVQTPTPTASAGE